MAQLLSPRSLPTCRTARTALRCFSAASASSSSTASAVDQIIEYAFGQCKTNPDMAVDVLMSGLSYSGSDPLGAARLHLSIAQIEADRNNWSKAHSHASNGLLLATPGAASSSSGSAAAAAAELVLRAGSMGTRALLIRGDDLDAYSLAAQCEQALRPTGHSGSPTSSSSVCSSTPHTRSLGLLALAARAAAPAASAADTGATQAAASAFGSLAAALGSDPAAAVRQDPALADAAHALGLLQVVERQPEAEVALAAAAAEAAAARAQAGSMPGGAAAAAWTLLQQHNAEVEADALTGRAQLQMRAREWGAAEELLGGALKAAEAAHGERSPSLAPLLTLLGYTYSRSARVTFAEGLYREAAKLLRLDPARLQMQPTPPPPPPESQQAQGQIPQQQSPLVRAAAEAGVHASTGAVLAWRYAQLLWVLPNRGGEADRWESCARQYWAGCGALGALDIGSVLGGKTHLKGEGSEGSGVVISTRFRRAWACAPPR